MRMLRLFEKVDSYRTNPSFNRVGEELAVYEADNPPFFSQHIVSRGSDGLRIPAERRRPRFLDSTLKRPNSQNNGELLHQEEPVRNNSVAPAGRVTE